MVLEYTSHIHKQVRLPGPVLDPGLLMVTIFSGNMDKAQRQQNDKESTHSRSSASIAMIAPDCQTNVMLNCWCSSHFQISSLKHRGLIIEQSLAKHSFDLCCLVDSALGHSSQLLLAPLDMLICTEHILLIAFESLNMIRCDQHRFVLRRYTVESANVIYTQYTCICVCVYIYM